MSVKPLNDAEKRKQISVRHIADGENSMFYFWNGQPVFFCYFPLKKYNNLFNEQ